MDKQMRTIQYFDRRKSLFTDLSLGLMVGTSGSVAYGMFDDKDGGVRKSMAVTAMNDLPKNKTFIFEWDNPYFGAPAISRKYEQYQLITRLDVLMNIRSSVVQRMERMPLLSFVYTIKVPHTIPGAGNHVR